MLVGTLASISIFFAYDVWRRERDAKARQQKQAEEKARRDAAYRERNTVRKVYKPSTPFRTVATPRVGTPDPVGVQGSTQVNLDNPHLMAQDCCRPLSRKLSQDPAARLHVREAAAGIRQQMIDRFTDIV